MEKWKTHVIGPEANLLSVEYVRPIKALNLKTKYKSYLVGFITR